MTEHCILYREKLTGKYWNSFPLLTVIYKNHIPGIKTLGFKWKYSGEMFAFWFFLYPFNLNFKLFEDIQVNLEDNKC